MKSVRKLSAAVTLTLVLGCSAFAGVISGGIASTPPQDASGGVISGGYMQVLVIVSTIL